MKGNDMDFVKGKLEIVQVSVSTYQIWAKPKPNRKAVLVARSLNEDDAKELVRRWNAFEDGGLVDELKDVIQDMLNGLAYLRNTKTEPYGFGIDRLEKTGQAALAKS